MSILIRSGIRIIATTATAVALVGTASAASLVSSENARVAGNDEALFSGDHRAVSAGKQLAARDNVYRYYGAHQLIGSYVLNLSGERIGQVDNLIIDDAGKITQVLIALKDSLDMDGTPVPVEPHRAEIVSVRGAQITIIRVDMTREELVQAQLTRLKSNARAPIEREIGSPDRQQLVDPLY